MTDEPTPPDEIAGYDPGTAQEAVSDSTETRTVWVADHEREKRWWFKITDQVPVRKKQSIVEKNTTATPDGVEVDSTYYVDMLEYLIQDWSGSGDADAPSIREFLTSAYRTKDPENPVFEDLWSEVPPPFGDLSDADLNV
jgi:hypothetical protein